MKPQTWLSLSFEGILLSAYFLSIRINHSERLKQPWRHIYIVIGLCFRLCYVRFWENRGHLPAPHPYPTLTPVQCVTVLSKLYVSFTRHPGQLQQNIISIHRRWELNSWSHAKKWIFFPRATSIKMGYQVWLLTHSNTSGKVLRKWLSETSALEEKAPGFH